MPKINIPDQEKIKIEQAVTEFEKKTHCEMVPYIVTQSDKYRQAPFVASLITGVILILALNILSNLWMLPFKFDIFSYSIIFLLIVFLVFGLVYFIPKLRIAIIPEKVEKEMVSRRAKEAFLDEEIFNTQHRNGILIFVSKLERNITIIADTGFTGKVSNEDWQAIIDKMTLKLKKNNTFGAILSAIKDCEDLLIRKDFDKISTNKNELSNELRKDI